MKFGKITGLFLSLIMIFNICVCSRDLSTYDCLNEQNSEFLERLRNEDLPNTRINEFLNEMDNEADKLQTNEDIYTLEDYFLVILFNIVLADEDFADVCGAFDSAFSEELDYMLENEMKLPDLFSEFFLSVMYDKIKAYNTEENEENGDFSSDLEENEGEDEKKDENGNEFISDNKAVFSDVSEDFWAYEHIMSLYEKDIVNGYTEDSFFRPSEGVTRAELAKTLCSAFLPVNRKANIKYADALDKWYSEYVAVCEYYGIFSGILSEDFRGDEIVTRQEMCTTAYRAFLCSGKKSDMTQKYDFPDMNKLFPYAVEAVEYLQSAGIIEGYGDHNFYPFVTTTRAELCKVINMLR